MSGTESTQDGQFGYLRIPTAVSLDAGARTGFGFMSSRATTSRDTPLETLQTARGMLSESPHETSSETLACGQSDGCRRGSC